MFLRTAGHPTQNHLFNLLFFLVDAFDRWCQVSISFVFFLFGYKKFRGGTSYYHTQDDKCLAPHIHQELFLLYDVAFLKNDTFYFGVLHAPSSSSPKYYVLISLLFLYIFFLLSYLLGSFENFANGGRKR